jgi:hypothetical protein
MDKCLLSYAILLILLVLYELNRLIRNFALCFHPVEIPERDILFFALEKIIHNTLASEMNRGLGKISSIQFGLKRYELPGSVVVSRDKVSLHNPMHYFLSLCLSASMTSDAHAPQCWSFLQTIADNFEMSLDFCVVRIIESCVQHFSLISQIKSGFWVRNGTNLLYFNFSHYIGLKPQFSQKFHCWNVSINSFLFFRWVRVR